MMQKKQSAAFWDKEYETQEHFALSKNPSEDLEKFCRYIERNHGGFPQTWNVLDIGCGNGRHLLYLARAFGARGLGFDISRVAIEQAKKDIRYKIKDVSIHEIDKSRQEYPISYILNPSSVLFEVGDISDPLPVATDSCDLVLDMMSSHMLSEDDRPNFVRECARVLSPGSWLLLKTFLLDEDAHAKRMLQKFPATKTDGTLEHNSYIHPRLGYLEHVYTLEEIRALYEPYFIIEKCIKSHAHVVDGRPNKRRFVCVYMTKRK